MTNQSNSVVISTDKNFHDLQATADVVLLMFSADWCPACKTMDPVINELARDFSGSVTVAKVDVAVNPALTAQYGIRNIPVLLLFSNGQPAHRHIGVTPKTILNTQLSRLLAERKAIA